MSARTCRWTLSAAPGSAWPSPAPSDSCSGDLTRHALNKGQHYRDNQMPERNHVGERDDIVNVTSSLGSVAGSMTEPRPGVQRPAEH
jgi:hypothetical protein